MYDAFVKNFNFIALILIKFLVNKLIKTQIFGFLVLTKKQNEIKKKNREKDKRVHIIFSIDLIEC